MRRSRVTVCAMCRVANDGEVCFPHTELYARPRRGGSPESRRVGRSADTPYRRLGTRERCLASPDRAPLPRPGHAAHRVVQELRRGRSYGPTDPVHVECGDGACTARCTKLQASLGSFAAGTNQACSWLLRERTLHTTQYQPKQHPRRRSSTSRICSVIIHAAVDLTGAQMAEDEDEMNLSPLANLAGRA